MGLLGRGKLKLADQEAARALKTRPNKLALYVRARVALQTGKRKEAEQLLRALIRQGGDGYGARLALGTLALGQKNLVLAERELAAAKRFDPERSRPYFVLARAFKRAGKTRQLIGELKGLAQIEQQSYGFVQELTALLHKQKDWAGVRTYGMRAYYIQPGSAWLHGVLAEAYEAPAPRADLKRAIWHLETALLCNPKDPAALQLRLARTQLRRGDRVRARRAAMAAQKLNPGLAGLKELLKQLR